MRGRPELEDVGARVARAGGGDLCRLAAHPRGARRRRRRTSTRVYEVPPGVDVDEFVLAAARRGARGAGRGGARATRPNPGNANERLPDEGNAERLEAFLAGDGPTVVYFGKLIENKGVQLLLEAMQRRSTRALVVVGFGRLPRRSWRRMAPDAHALHRPARAPPPRAPAAARRRRRSCRRSSPRRSGWSPPRPPRPARRRSSRATRASPRSRPGSRRSYPERFAAPRLVRARRRRRPARKLDGAARAPRRRPRRARVARRGGPSSSAGRGHERRATSASSRSTRAATLPRWARSSAVPRQELLATSRASVRGRHRLHARRRGGVRAPRPRLARAVDRFEELQAAARGTDLEPTPRRRADRLRGRGAHGQVRRLRRGGRAMRERRAQLHALARELRLGARRRPARIRGAAGRTSGSSTRRTTAGTTSSSATSSGATTPSACTCTSASAAPTARSRCTTRSATSCPSCSRCRRARRSSRTSTPACTRRAPQIFTRMFPRCGIPDPYDGWRGLRGLRLASSTAPARSPSTRSSGGACGRTSPTRRSRSGSATPSPTSARRSPSRRSPTRSPPAAPARIDEGEPLPDLPHRLLEENLWRAIRYGLSGELIDFERGEPIPARARIEQLLEWVAPVADEIGAAPFLAVPGAERRRAADRARRRGRDARRRSTPSRSRAGEPIGG